MPSRVKTGEHAPAPAAEEKDPLIGTTLGAYRITGRLGRGGMGMVYQARQISLARDVALKVLPPGRAADKDFITRFVREARSAAKLNHPNIVQIYDVGKVDDVYFFSMELVRGGTLRALLQQEGPLTPERAVRYAIQAARGLEYAHGKGIIHRDIKPDNLMIGDDGSVKVADLGLAKGPREGDASMTSSGIAMGTPHYMAPEQATDAKHADRRSDIYSLGCTLYHLVTGRVPHHGTSAFEIVVKHVNEPLVPAHAVNPNVPEALSAVIGRMTAKNAAERFGSMSEVIAALEGQGGTEPPRTAYLPDTQQVTRVRAFCEALRKLEHGDRRQERTAIICIAGGALAITAVIGFVTGSPRVVAATVTYAALSMAFFWMLAGAARSTYLYRRVRRLLAGNGALDWAVLVFLAGGAVALMVFLKFMTAFGVTAVLAAGTAGLYYWAGRLPMLVKRYAELEQVRQFVDAMRERGMSLEDAQVFLCEHGGAYGEIACEELYGYEAMAAAIATSKLPRDVRRPLAVRARAWLIGLIDSVEAWRNRRAEAKALKRERAAAAKAAAPAPDVREAPNAPAASPEKAEPPSSETAAPEPEAPPVTGESAPAPESPAPAPEPEQTPSESVPAPEAEDAPSVETSASETATEVAVPEQGTTESAAKPKKKRKTSTRRGTKKPRRTKKPDSE
jgi:hypothetical protein